MSKRAGEWSPARRGEAIAKMELRVMGMTTNHAASFRRTERQKISRALASKFNLSEEQIRRMIPAPPN
jgi:hypothetical protein